MAKDVQKITHIKVGRRAREEENLPNNWEDLDINNLTISKDKTVFFFGGNTTNRAVAGNGNIKIMASHINNNSRNKTALYSFWYQEEPLRSEGFLSKDYMNEAIILYNKTFKPLLFDEKGNIKSKKGLEHTFAKLVFGAHCGGSDFVNVIINEMYKTLTQEYPENVAEFLINKIKYFSYAPNSVLDHNVNALVIAPYVDPGFSWSKALQAAEDNKIDVDYPKGIMKTLFKAKQQGCFQNIFNKAFKSYRTIMFKVGNTVYMISNQINPDRRVGDHSIECIRRRKSLSNKTDCEINAQLACFASSLFINQFLEHEVVDLKSAFGEVSELAESNNNFKVG